MSTRQTRKEATRRALEEAALACFAEHGFDATTIGMITRRAGVAHGTFYVHFPTREALLDSLLDAFNAGFTARLLPVVTGGGDLQTTLRGAAIAFLDHWDAHRAFIEAYVQRVAAGLSMVALRDGLSQTLVDVVAAWIGQLAADAGQPLEAPRLVTQALLAMWFRLGLQSLFNPDVERAQVIDALVRMTWGALTAMTPALTSAAPDPPTDLPLQPRTSPNLPEGDAP